MSQPPHDEDGFILSQFPAGFRGYAADVGAADGLETSNTLKLEVNGWSVLCVEPNPDVQVVLRANRKLVEDCACSDYCAEAAEFHINARTPSAYSALILRQHPDWTPDEDTPWRTANVRVETLDVLLERHKFPRLDALSVDCEGGEIEVLRGLELSRWRPKVIVCESWAEFGEVVPYLADRGYRRVERRFVNDLFLRSDGD